MWAGRGCGCGDCGECVMCLHTCVRLCAGRRGVNEPIEEQSAPWWSASVWDSCGDWPRSTVTVKIVNSTDFTTFIYWREEVAAKLFKVLLMFTATKVVVGDFINQVCCN